ncbi:MAG: hypothetical protein JL50_01600 [Peptococcaceae bacterium BICA1-7]|nr:MAG: hypothetical protein JL50_01600 [Peptococcaceae bacterium BICA1-7]HBV96223.1 hypothetical protein [Desulfotomaculum sp.]
MAILYIILFFLSNQKDGKKPPLSGGALKLLNGNTSGRRQNTGDKITRIPQYRPIRNARM